MARFNRTSDVYRWSGLCCAGAMFALAALIARPTMVHAWTVVSGDEVGQTTTAAEASRLSRTLGPSFITVNTGTFLLMTDAPGERLAAYVDALEQFASRYSYEMRTLGLTLRPTHEPLLVVVFSSHDAFERFAKSMDGVDATTMGGYYHTGANRAALYDGATSAQMRQAMRALDEVRFAAAHARERAINTDDRRLAALLTSWADETWARIESEEARLSRLALEETLGRLVHEAAHVLTHNTGVFSRAAAPPAWLSEGLAESFARGELSGAPQSMEHAHTAEAWRIVHVVTPPGACAEEPGAFYDHCRVVFDTLLREKPEALAACLRDAGTWRGDPAALFAAHFGDPGAFAARGASGFAAAGDD